MEDIMKSAQDYIVIFWLIPVIIQIILPLLYLIGYGFYNLIKGTGEEQETFSLDDADISLETA